MSAIHEFTPDLDGEVLRPAFPDVSPTERSYTQVSYGLPFDKACQKHVQGFLDATRVYIIASRSLNAQTANVKQLEEALGPRHVGTWIGIPSHTPYNSLIPILQDMKAKEVDCLITLGGGSLADGAKTMIYALENAVTTLDDLEALGTKFQHVDEVILKGIGNPAKIRLVFVPTTLSGAEYSRYGGCTNPKDHLKTMFSHPSMFASLLILDPELCRTMPDWVWRSTGVRAIDHCCENICSINARPESDAACQRGLVRLIRSLLAYTRNPDDLDARLESQLGTNNAMTGLLLMVYCGASHGIGHQLGPLGVGHGVTSCILLPAVMKYNARATQERQDNIKHILWSDDEIASVLKKHHLEQQSSDVGDALRAVFDELGMPRSLKEAGIGRDKWETVARNSLQDHMCTNNPIPLTTVEQVYEILTLVES